DERLHPGTDGTASGARAGARGRRSLRPALAGRQDARPVHGHRPSLVHLGPAGTHALCARVPPAHEGPPPDVAHDVGRDLRVDREPACRITAAGPVTRQSRTAMPSISTRNWGSARPCTTISVFAG